MNLFRQPRSSASPAQIQQVKAWVQGTLQLDSAVPISLSQLQCHEPGCPPIETVIAIMTQPTQTYKIHAAIADLDEAQVQAALQAPGTPSANPTD